MTKKDQDLFPSFYHHTWAVLIYINPLNEFGYLLWYVQLSAALSLSASDGFPRGVFSHPCLVALFPTPVSVSRSLPSAKTSLLFSLPFPGCPVLSSPQPLGDQHLLTRQKINGKIVYTNLRKEILDLSITVLCPDWKKIWRQRTQPLNNTRMTFTWCTQTLYLHLCTCKYTNSTHIYEKKRKQKVTEPRNQLL